MELSGKERKILREEILGIYPNQEELQVFLSGEMDFAAIAKGDVRWSIF